MKTRTQPERRARKSKLESGGQTKKAKVSSPSLRRGRRRRQRIRALAAVEEVGAVAVTGEGAASAAGRPGNPRLLPLRRPVAIAGAASLPLTRHRYALMPLSSWLQLKQQIQAPVSAASVQSSTEGPKSQQIHQRSLRLTRSCSSVFPSQLRMMKKLKQQIQAPVSAASVQSSTEGPKSQQKPEQHKHTWTDPEEEALFEFAGIVAAGLSYQANKKEFSKRVAVMMNDRFQVQVNRQYVPLDATKVRMKLDRFQGSWEVQPSGSKKMYTSLGGEITGRDQLWTQLFSPSEATRSDAGSKKRKSREDTTPKDKESALEYMVERESSVAARLIFAAALACPNILSVFWCLDGYQSRRQHLIDTWKTGIVRVPELEGIHPSLLPADFR